MSKITASTDFDRVPEDQTTKYITMFCEQVAQVFNKGISVGDNFDGALVTCGFSSASADGTYTHNLGRVPVGYIVCSLSTAMIVYTGGVAWTTSTISLRSSAIGTALIFVF